MKHTFVKMQGLGNDFILFDALSTERHFHEITLAQIRHLCNRHFGIGADGLLILKSASNPATADIAWNFYNADGTKAEMCGNAVRCVARYVYETGLWPVGSNALRLETLAGIKELEVVRNADGSFAAVRVDMGTAKPDATFEIEGMKWQSISMGNPHAVTFVDELPFDFGTAPVTTIGPIIETDQAFPHKTNVEFAQILDDTHIRMRVWERGVGETMACATGASAVAVAAVIAGHLDALPPSAPITVELLGGELQIEVRPSDLRVIMTGPAERVFEGILTL